MSTMNVTVPPWLAGVSCLGFSIMFVGSLYIFPAATKQQKLHQQMLHELHQTGNVSNATASSLLSPGTAESAPESRLHHLHQQEAAPKLDRDHPLVIVQRFKGILLTSILVPIYLWWVFSLSGALPADQSFWSRLGLFLSYLGIEFPDRILHFFNHLFIPLILIAILFSGQIFMMGLSKELPFQQAFDWGTQRKALRGLIGIRNFVVGPIAEEFIFRACMVSISAHSGASVKQMVFLLPLVFGIAHAHHGYEQFNKKGRTRKALQSAVAMVCLQLAYTSLFGWFATFLFIRTSNLIGPCLVHSFCNLMGLPDVTNIPYYGRWKYWLYFLFVAGMISFGLLLGPLTNPVLYGVQDVYWPVLGMAMDSASGVDAAATAAGAAGTVGGAAHPAAIPPPPPF